MARDGDVVLSRRGRGGGLFACASAQAQPSIGLWATRGETADEGGIPRGWAGSRAPGPGERAPRCDDVEEGHLRRVRGGGLWTVGSPGLWDLALSAPGGQQRQIRHDHPQ